MSDLVLDASAVLAWIEAEPGGEDVGERLADCVISAVNLAEVVAKLIDRGVEPAGAVEIVRAAAFHVEPFDEGLALEAGALRGRTRRHGLSLGDRACLALARREGAAALTADRAWGAVDVGVEVRLIR
ncbi:type II toxin-antitoxin system VapC family toxin [Phenylobacterium sp.]|uniref:type II toxin-antitoxin system VapC family toxin n=1 Tax=Phenylobacterium sp. TaxID=1871053 RepID=UPI0035B3991D